VARRSHGFSLGRELIPASNHAKLDEGLDQSKAIVNGGLRCQIPWFLGAASN